MNIHHVTVMAVITVTPLSVSVWHGLSVTGAFLVTGKRLVPLRLPPFFVQQTPLLFRIP
jgi:hypothetical protein